MPDDRGELDEGRLSPMHRCSRCLRADIGSLIFKLVATYAPMTCKPALIDSELEGIGDVIRANIQRHTQHWLAPHIDRPTHKYLKVSACALAEALMPQMTRRARLDADAVYVLHMLRSFNTA